jgi:chromosome segregation ATPase
MRRRVEYLEREVALRDGHLRKIKEDYDATVNARMDREREAGVLQSQLDERRQAYKALAQQAEQYKAEMLSQQRKVVELEEHLAECATADPKIDLKLWKDENFQLRLRVKESEIAAGTTDDCRIKSLIRMQIRSGRCDRRLPRTARRSCVRMQS